MSGGKRRLLVVDDEVDFSEFVRELAIRHGFDVETAENGRVAKEKFRTFSPDTIVIDIVMPQADGIEFIDWLGQSSANIRLVVVTGFNPHYAELAEKLAQARGLSSVVVLMKPVRVATLLKALNSEPS